MRHSLSTACRSRHRPIGVVCLLALVLAFIAAPVRAQDAWPTNQPKPQAPKKDQKPAPKPRDAAPDRDDLKDEAKKLFGPGARAPSDQAARDAAGWAVILAAFRGDEAQSAANVMLQRTRGEGGLPEAYIARRNDAYVIAVGDFPAPDDERAVKELARIQQIEVNGDKPFRYALLAPPSGSMKGDMPQYNLLQAKRQLGDDALYTLQIGAYGTLGQATKPTSEELDKVRKAAEEAAYKLRQEGEQAYYYHGPSMSMVTIGVFGVEDFDPQVPNFKSARLRDAQKRHPYNLYNGQGVREKIKGAPDRLQPSNLVAIPNK